MIVVKCLRCKYKQEVKTRGELSKCPKCREKYWLNYYENSYLNSQLNLENNSLTSGVSNKIVSPTFMTSSTDTTTKEMKGGDNNMTEKKKTITEERVEHANAVIDFLKSREVEESKMTAILSRAYSILKK